MNASAPTRRSSRPLTVVQALMIVVCLALCLAWTWGMMALRDALPIKLARISDLAAPLSFAAPPLWATLTQRTTRRDLAKRPPVAPVDAPSVLMRTLSALERPSLADQAVAAIPKAFFMLAFGGMVIAAFVGSGPLLFAEGMVIGVGEVAALLAALWLVMLGGKRLEAWIGPRRG